MRRAVLLLACIALALGGCGTSKEDKAKNDVCDARADIAKQVDTLSALTPSTITTDKVKESVNAIRADVSKIADAQGNLSEERRSEVKSATDKFTSELKRIASEVGRSLPAGEAKTQLTKAVDQIEAAYKQTYGRIDCS
jgi:Tfp pilus assembly protein PilP